MGMLGGWKDFYDEYLPDEENNSQGIVSHGDSLQNDNLETYHLLMGMSSSMTYHPLNREKEPYRNSIERDILQVLEDGRRSGEMI